MNYQKKLDNYLKWVVNFPFGQYECDYDSQAQTAKEIMFTWESKGIPLPKKSVEPELLKKYVAGKRSMDWHIEQWRVGLIEGTLGPKEIINELGITPRQYKKLIKSAYFKINV